MWVFLHAVRGGRQLERRAVSTPSHAAQLAQSMPSLRNAAQVEHREVEFPAFMRVFQTILFGSSEASAAIGIYLEGKEFRTLIT